MCCKHSLITGYLELMQYCQV